MSNLNRDEECCYPIVGQSTLRDSNNSEMAILRDEFKVQLKSIIYGEADKIANFVGINVCLAGLNPRLLVKMAGSHNNLQYC